MRPQLFFQVAMPMLAAVAASGQGTFVYDQQSSTDETPYPGVGGVMQQISSPWGQSFTPTLSSVGFIRLQLYDGNVGNALGATVYVNLRTDSIMGGVLAATDPVSMPDNFGGFTNFLFSNPVVLTAGTPYFFQPVVQLGDTWTMVGYNYYYLSGTAFFQGAAWPDHDFWFGEGIIVPEPSTVSIYICGTLILYTMRRRPHA